MLSEDDFGNDPRPRRTFSNASFYSVHEHDNVFAMWQFDMWQKLLKWVTKRKLWKGFAS